MSDVSRHKILSDEILLDGWARVRRVHYVQTRRDGAVQNQDRDLHDRGDGVTTLLHDPERGTVLLLQQPRIVATLRGSPTGETLEACSGLLGNSEPSERAVQEVMEETGYVAKSLEFVASVYESPGGSKDLVHLFLCEYSDRERRGQGGGLFDEGEDIELCEMTLEDALSLLCTGGISDARTMLLVQHLALRRAGVVSPGVGR